MNRAEALIIAVQELGANMDRVDANGPASQDQLEQYLMGLMLQVADERKRGVLALGTLCALATVCTDLYARGVLAEEQRKERIGEKLH